MLKIYLGRRIKCDFRKIMNPMRVGKKLQKSQDIIREQTPRTFL